MNIVLASISLEVSGAVIERYAEMSGDYNPIHTDPEFAARTRFGRVIAHGTLSMNLIYQWVEATFGDNSREFWNIEVRFRAPVFIGDVVTVSGRQISGKLCEVFIRNQDGITVLDGTVGVSEA